MRLGTSSHLPRGPEAREREERAMLFRIVAVVAAVASACSTADAATLDIVRSAKVDAIVHYVMRDRAIRALTLGVSVRGRIVYLKGYGTTVAAVMPIGSLTKSFTAAAVRTLAAEGRMDLQAPLSHYEPQFSTVGSVTIAQLLSMSSGIADYAALPSFNRNARAPVSPGALIASALEQPPAFAPGSQTAYSNTNYVLAALTVQSVTGEPYAAYLHRALLDPLQLRSTRVALGVEGFGCADLESNASDMLAWMRALDDGLLAPTPRAEGAYDDGFFNGTFFSHDASYSSGYVAGYSSFGVRLPADRTDIVLLGDVDAVDLSPLARSIAAIVLHIPEAAPRTDR